MYINQTQKRMKGIERILQNEEIVDAVSGAVDGKILGSKSKLNGVLVLTSERTIFYYKKLIGGFQFEDYPLDKISSINFNTGMITSSIKIHASNNDLEMGWIPKDEKAEDFVKNVKSHMSSPKEKIPTNESKNFDVADQLKKLADLKEQGILNVEEFSAQKKKILNM